MVTEILILAAYGYSLEFRVRHIIQLYYFFSLLFLFLSLFLLEKVFPVHCFGVLTACMHVISYLIQFGRLCQKLVNTGTGFSEQQHQLVNSACTKICSRFWFVLLLSNR